MQTYAYNKIQTRRINRHRVVLKGLRLSTIVVLKAVHNLGSIFVTFNPNRRSNSNPNLNLNPGSAM